jgi:NADPH:quinone reductase-like Zn-dependent oxidoreductase
MSRTIKFSKAGGPEVLEFIDEQVAAPAPHEVRIKVKAIGLNRADVTYIPQVEDTIWREFRCQSGGRNAHLARRVA